MDKKRVTVPEIGRMKGAGERITMVTAYDYPFARLLDEAGVDVLLVGDSLGMVVQGQDNTVPVTLDEMIYHTRMVARGRRRALVVGDLPFGSYQASPTQAVPLKVAVARPRNRSFDSIPKAATRSGTVPINIATDCAAAIPGTPATSRPSRASGSSTASWPMEMVATSQ